MFRASYIELVSYVNHHFCLIKGYFGACPGNSCCRRNPVNRLFCSLSNTKNDFRGYQEITPTIVLAKVHKNSETYVMLTYIVA